ncbi:hypothetical protein COV28_02490 [candidate division WWE3 bacterium CG10_big_fil_rev_8_21_14_0_10_48_23]|uniref:TrbC/VIRB2 family protein n=1 Tax=candidate division WWE3 bacterium CG_4_9_14_0_2_um_filter_48_10 TaxID=1975078 RepID=A0A2M8EJU2_UNCKA|nr:MAG: hypothetical protein CO059_00880 [candidate division WWE3 bacterium CG_4_9_14_0_2_um_filter_48_10]PJE51255.1 MAG: hypothetical protein COV28_02490 [candidate division WWE3 bacterium CG10_big_fil_rev_8_21_14_0_10_48_23]
MRKITQSVLGGLIGGVLALIFPAFVQAAVIPDGGGCPFEGELFIKLVNILSETIEFLLGIGAGVALLFVMIGGIQYMASGGDEKSLASAKKTITYSIIGLVVILGSILIINVLRDIFGFNYC